MKLVWPDSFPRKGKRPENRALQETHNRITPLGSPQGGMPHVTARPIPGQDEHSSSPAACFLPILEGYSPIS
jgi:hypothetical protein